MIIEKIVLKNYRCYKNSIIETTETNLNLDKPGIVLFTGDNSVGKTTLFNAIGWALYSRETQTILNHIPSTLSIPSVNSFDNTGSSTVQVELHIKDIGSISKLTLTRIAKFNKNQVDPLESEVILHLKYNDENEDSYLSSLSQRETVQSLIKQLFPRDMASFHLFDGEFLQLTYTNKGDTIVKGIRNMFKIFRIEDLREASREVEVKYQKERVKYTDNAKIQSKINEENNLISQRDEITREIDELKVEIRKIKDQNKEIDDKLETLGNVDDIKNKMDRLKEIDKEIQDKTKAIRETVHDKIKLILKNAYLINSEEIFSSVSKTAEKLIERGKLPPEIKDTFVKDLMEKGTCICGNPLIKGTTHWETMEHLLKEIAGSSDMEVLQDVYYSIEISKSNINTIRNKVIQENLNYDKYNSEKDSLNIKRNNLMGDLQGFESYEDTVSNYQNLRKQRDRNLESNNTFSRRQGTLESELSNINEKINNLRDDIHKFKEKSDRFQLYESYYKKAQKLHQIFASIVENIISEIAERYQKEVNQMIKKIPLLSQFTVNISVSKEDPGKMDFEFLQNGDKKIYMAGGQNQLMGILLIAAFTKVIRESKSEDITAPFVVIDNPVSTLSKDNMLLFGKILNELFDGIHLILFTKNTDYKDIINGAVENISRFYRLSKNEADGSTLINRGEI